MQKPDVDLEKECRNCLHRKTGWLCKNPQSGRFEQEVSSEETCGNFTVSTGQAHFVRALSSSFFMLNTKSASEREQGLRQVLDHYGAAIAEGIPKEDEVQARIGIATACALVVGHQLQTSGKESALESEEGLRVLSEMESASALEKKYNLSEVAKIWYQLSKVDALIAFKTTIIARDQSAGEGESFLRQQLELFDHISPTPLPKSLSLLGTYLLRQGKNEAAAECFRNVLDLLSCKEAMLLGNAEGIRRDARILLEQATAGKVEAQANTGARRKTDTQRSTSEKTGCFIATAVYGSELAPQVVFLKRFRDEALLPSRTGRFFVTVYYHLSPPAAYFIAQHPKLSAFIRQLVVVPTLKFAKLVLKHESE